MLELSAPKRGLKPATTPILSAPDVIVLSDSVLWLRPLSDDALDKPVDSVHKAGIARLACWYLDVPFVVLDRSGKHLGFACFEIPDLCLDLCPDIGRDCRAPRRQRDHVCIEITQQILRVRFPGALFQSPEFRASESRPR